VSSAAGEHEDHLDTIRELMDRLDVVDSLFTEDRLARDLAERLADAAADAAEDAAETAHTNRRLLTGIAAVLTTGLLLWTPVVAYGAVWGHERVRNTCYPAAGAQQETVEDPYWYCGIFPGTGRPDPARHP